MRKVYFATMVLYAAITAGLVYLSVQMLKDDHPWWSYVGNLIALSIGGVSVYFSYRAFRTGVADPRRPQISRILTWGFLLWLVVWMFVLRRG